MVYGFEQLHYITNREEIFNFNKKKGCIYAAYGVSQTPNKDANGKDLTYDIEIVDEDGNDITDLLDFSCWNVESSYLINGLFDNDNNSYNLTYGSEIDEINTYVSVKSSAGYDSEWVLLTAKTGADGSVNISSELVSPRDGSGKVTVTESEEEGKYNVQIVCAKTHFVDSDYSEAIVGIPDEEYTQPLEEASEFIESEVQESAGSEITESKNEESTESSSSMKDSTNESVFSEESTETFKEIATIEEQVTLAESNKAQEENKKNESSDKKDPTNTSEVKQPTTATPKSSGTVSKVSRVTPKAQGVVAATNKAAPQTGDKSNAPLWITIAGTSVGVLTTAVIAKRKKKI